MIDVRCQCGKKLQLGDEWAGKPGRCPDCGTVLRIGQPTDRSLATLPPTSNLVLAPPMVSKTPGKTRVSMRMRIGIIGTFAVAALVGGWWFSGGSSDKSLANLRPVPKSDPSTVTDETNRPIETEEEAEPKETLTPGSTVAEKKGPAATDDEKKRDGASDRSLEQSNKQRPDKERRSKKDAKSQEPSRGLTGVSAEFDDFHCSRIQSQSGVRIPFATNVLEVDGKLVAVANLSDAQKGVSPSLFLRPGKHSIRFRNGEGAVSIAVKEDIAATMQQMHRFFDMSGTPKEEELLARGARAFDVHHAPFLLNLQGEVYRAKKDLEAAERFFRRSLRINPAFSPAHFNLAKCHIAASANELAIHEIQLATEFNIDNVFGIEDQLIKVRRELNVARINTPIELDVQRYVSAERLSVEDDRIVALMQGMAKYAVREEDRGKVLNNLALHFADTSRPEMALEFFRDSLAAFRMAGTDRGTLSKRVFVNMESTCRKAGFVEADHYRWMQDEVTP